MDLEVNKRRVKVQYDKSVHPRRFSEGTALAEPRNGLYLKNTMHDLQPWMIIVYYCTIF